MAPQLVVRVEPRALPLTLGRCEPERVEGRAPDLEAGVLLQTLSVGVAEAHLSHGHGHDARVGPRSLIRSEPPLVHSPCFDAPHATATGKAPALVQGGEWEASSWVEPGVQAGGGWPHRPRARADPESHRVLGKVQYQYG